MGRRIRRRATLPPTAVAASGTCIERNPRRRVQFSLTNATEAPAFYNRTAIANETETVDLVPTPPPSSTGATAIPTNRSISNATQNPVLTDSTQLRNETLAQLRNGTLSCAELCEEFSALCELCEEPEVNAGALSVPCAEYFSIAACDLDPNCRYIHTLSNGARGRDVSYGALAAGAALGLYQLDLDASSSSSASGNAAEPSAESKELSNASKKIL